MQFKNGKKLASALLAASMVAAAIAPQTIVYADSTRVVTLGADLSDERRQAILNYFGVSGANVETIYVTNTDERNLLSSYIPLEVIGTRTLSCAYVNPTKSGGIQVKTANLTWVTSNMIASALSTSGVSNCEVIAACPIPVSGTGALAGVLKAYETAAGQVLDATKKEIAAQEIVTTSDIAEYVGQDQATKIVNDIKLQIIEDQVDYYDEDMIYAIVDEAIADVVDDLRNERDELVELNDQQREQLEQLAQKIAEQNYNFDDVKETLQRVEQNVSNQTAGDVNVNVSVNNNNQDGNNSASSTTGDSQTELAADSILTNTNDGALGEDVIEDATTQEAITNPVEPTEQPEAPTPEPVPETTGGDSPFEIVTTDQTVFSDGTEETPADQTQQPVTEELQDNTDETQPYEEPQTPIEEVFPTEEVSDTPTEQEQPEAVTDTTEWNTDETVIPSTDENQEGIEALPDDSEDEWTDGATTDEGETDENGDGSEGEPSEDEAPAAALPQLKIGSGDASFNGFAVKLYTDGNVVPASGTVTFTDADGAETRVDLAESGSYGVIPVEDSSELDQLGFAEANEIFVLTDRLGLAGGQYHVKAEVVFADADDDHKPIPGTEKDMVSAENDLTYFASALVPQRPEEGYVAPTTVTLRAYAPEGTASADVTSSDESVAYPGIFTMDETSGLVDVDLEDTGITTINVTYYDENGEVIGQDGIEIAGF